MTASINLPESHNHPLELAKQYDQKGEQKKAVRFYRLAGEHAFANYAMETAEICFRRALELTQDRQLEARYALMFWLERVFALSGQPEARSQNLANLAAVADAMDSDLKRADVAARLTLFKLDSGDNQDVLSIARLAVRIAQVAGAAAAEAALYLIWGRALQRLGEYDSARQKFQRALGLAQEYDLPETEADSYRYMGVVYEENGRYSQAKTLYKQALAIYETTHERRGQSNMLNNLGKLAYDQGEYTAALRYWDHAQTTCLEIGDKLGSCRILVNQSAIYMDLGDYDRARQLNDEALKLSREIRLRFGESLALINLSLVNHYLADQETALRYGTQALNLSLEMGSKRLEGFAHNTLGRVLKASNRFEEAAEHYWEAVAIWHEMEQSALLMEAEAGLAGVALAAGDQAEAMTQIKSILGKLDGIADLAGTESPFDVYLTCYNVLTAAQDARADIILQRSHEQLTERANAIRDETSRQMFLEQIATHRQIIEIAAGKVLN